MYFTIQLFNVHRVKSEKRNGIRRPLNEEEVCQLKRWVYFNNPSYQTNELIDVPLGLISPVPTAPSNEPTVLTVSVPS